MQPILGIPKVIQFVYLRGGLSLRWLIVLTACLSSGCQSILCHPFPVHSEVQITDCGKSYSDEGYNQICDAGVDPSFCYQGHGPHFPFKWGGAARLRSLGAKAKGHIHNNCLTRTAHAHRAAKNAPPWPRFHPLPSGPVFFRSENQFSADGIPMASTSSPNKSDTSDELSDQSVAPSEETVRDNESNAPPMTANYGQFSASKSR